MFDTFHLVVISRSIHVLANGIISFFLMAESYSIVYMYHIVFKRFSYLYTELHLTHMVFYVDYKKVLLSPDWCFSRTPTRQIGCRLISASTCTCVHKLLYMAALVTQPIRWQNQNLNPDPLALDPALVPSCLPF